MTEQHAKYSPSDSDRWGPDGCDAALILYPNEDDGGSIHSWEGTFAHALLELCLKQSKTPADFLDKEIFYGIVPKDYDGERPDTYCRQDMIDYMEPVMDYITDRFFSVEGETPTLWSEAKVEIHPLCSGTLDVGIYWPKAQQLEIIDLKWGKGVMVEADAPQLAIYAGGAAIGMKCTGLKKVITTVAQPRGHHPAGPIRSHERSWGDLTMTIENIKGRIDYLEGLNGQAEGNPTKDACMWCPGKKQGCKWRTKQAADSVSRIVEEQHEAVPSGTPFTEDELFLIEHAELIEQVLTSARARLTDQILSGGEGFGYKLIESRSNRIWKHGAEEIKEFLNKKLRMKVGDITEPKLKGIPAIEKLAKKLPEAKQELFAALIDKPRGKPKLVTQDSDGTPYKSADTMFEATDEVDFL